MGVCCSSKYEHRIQSYHQYPRRGYIKIKQRNQTGQVVGASIASFQVTQPIILTAQQLELRHLNLIISTCVLPGLDPRGHLDKECQDFCFYTHSDSTFILGLFDGHGRDGRRLVNFCSQVAQRYFYQNEQKYKHDPKKLLVNLTHKCDQEVSSPACKIDSVHSGSTAVFCYFHQGTLYCSSVGDSRAVIATTKPSTVHPPLLVSFGSSSVLKSVTHVSDFRLEAVQLTKDQKPEDPGERERITKAGGRVARLQDEHGNRIGPYRAWEMHCNRPGLAMSRSIGDEIGRKIGVISTPIVTVYELQEGFDYFIVLASDGIWDVFQNQQVVDFVEQYRQKCKVQMNEVPNANMVSYQNTCIAQILCEEARQRWYLLVEEEDVLIDDISCVILEFINQKAPTNVSYVRKKTEIQHDANDSSIPEMQRSPTITETRTNDPRRNSIIGDIISQVISVNKSIY